MLLRRVNFWLVPALPVWALPLFLPLGFVGIVGQLQTTMLFGLGMFYAHRKEELDA